MESDYGKTVRGSECKDMINIMLERNFTQKEIKSAIALFWTGTDSYLFQEES